jgi:organic radical activating enzyme
MQSGRVAQLAEQLAAEGRPVMLETNGTLVPALHRTLPWLTYVSMDLKLPSVDSERVAPGTQRKFLDAALRAGVTTWVKVVVGPSTDLGQFDSAITMVSQLSAAGRAGPGAGGSGETDRRPEIFLQPVTPFGDVGAAPTPDQVLELQERALRRYPRVRVIPQTHKAIGQL